MRSTQTITPSHRPAANVCAPVKRWRGIALALVLLCAGCASQRFPLLKPVPELDQHAEARFRAQDYFLAGRDYDRRNLPQMAEQCYKLAYQLDPESSDLRLMLAEKQILNGKASHALILLKGDRPVAQLSTDERRLAAQAYMKMGQPQRALEVMATLPDLSPAERLSIGLLHEARGDLPNAIAQFAWYFDEYPESVEMGLKLSDLYRRVKQYDRADSLSRQLVAQNGPRGDVLNGWAVLRLDRGDTLGALDCYRQALAADSLDQQTLQNMAGLFIQQQAFDSAAVLYGRLNAANPGDPYLYGRTLGLLYYYAKRYEDAEKVFTGLLSSKDADYEVHFYLGLVYGGRENFTAATGELEKALAIKPELLEAWQNLTYLAVKQKKMDQAIDYAQRCTRALPKKAEAWRLLGYTYNLDRQYKNAIEPLKRAVQADGADAGVLFELGSAYERAGQLDDAARAFRGVLAINPRDAATANYLGYMWAEHNVKLDSARTLIELALKEEPDNGAFLDSYAWVLYMQGDYDKAYQYITKALDKMGQDPIIHSHCGDILAKMRKSQQAVEAYRRSIELGSEEKDALQAKIGTLANPAP
jgi:tetratricopeptide (TPR) repeat protein